MSCAWFLSRSKSPKWPFLFKSCHKINLDVIRFVTFSSIPQGSFHHCSKWTYYND